MPRDVNSGEAIVLENVLSIMQDDWVMLALPFFFGALLIEWLWAKQQTAHLYDQADFKTSMGIMALTVVVDVVPKALGIALMFLAYELSPFKGMINPTWFWWVVLFFLDDLTYYLFHRANHEVRLMWAGHVSHHNSTYYNLGTALRQGVGERVLKYLFWCPLALIGFHPVMIVTMLSCSLIYQYWLHTQAFYKLPRWFEFIFNTPSHHRVHHGANVRYLDRNHAATLIIWDRIFGTFAEEREEEPVVYGITKNIDTHNVLKASFGEYHNLWRDVARAERWRDKLRYIFSAPGWSHDGEDKRSNILRAQAYDQSAA
jgi:sterol desaturase/sphingolipid hydroxylase (fatty acid hydroxylase superfamily)